MSGLPVIPINSPAILAAYASIYAWTHGAVVPTMEASPPKPARSMSQNDLWIAATAHAMRAVILSTDKDFMHLDGIWLKHLLVSQEA